MIFGYLNSGETNSNFSHSFTLQQGKALAQIPFTRSLNWQNQNAGLLQQDNKDSKLTGTQPSTHPASGCTIVAWARIDNDQEIIDKIPNHLHELCDSDAGIILAAYLHWSEKCCEHLIGDFAFAIYDPRDDSLFLGRDHMGVKPLYYYYHQGLLVFASSLAVFDSYPKLDTQYNTAWLARFLIGRSQDWIQTPYLYIKKCPPAHCMKATPNKQPTPIRYFEFSHASTLQLPADEDYVKAYKSALDEAVRCRVSDNPQLNRSASHNGLIGSELSGGLDSSSITAIAALQMQQPAKKLHCLGFAVQQLTGEALSAVAQTSSVAMTHMFTNTNDHNMSTEDFLAFNGIPEEHGNATSHYPIYRHCQTLGITTLLSGFGGDEFVTNAAPTAMVELWKNKKWRLFYKRMRGNITSKPLHTLRWLYLYYRYNNQSVTSRRLQAIGKISWPHYSLKTDAIKQYDLFNKFHAGLKYDGSQTTQNGFSLNDRWSPMMTARLENCTLAAARYGIEYRWPLLDIRLLKLFLSIPASQKIGPNGMGRYLHRRAVADIIPEYITWGPKELIQANWILRRLMGERYIRQITRSNALIPAKGKPLTPQNTINKATISIPRPQQKPVSELALHHELQPLIVPEKITQLRQKLHDTPDPQKRRLLSKPLQKIATLNTWLLHRDKLESQKQLVDKPPTNNE